MSNVEKNLKIRKFTTGQVSGFTMVGRQSLYRYVRDFPEFFTETAKQHRQGRRWELDDLTIVQSIRMLYHERRGTEKIRELSKGGWQLSDNQSWTRELQSRLIEATFAAYADAEEISKKALNAIEELKLFTGVAKYNNEEFAALWIKVMDLQEEFRVWEQELKITGRVHKAAKRKWWGKPPVLYLAPVEGSLNDYKIANADRQQPKHDHTDKKESF